ncbi:hypothetical protein EJB05_22420, partial [Eragrostis curvula]
MFSSALIRCQPEPPWATWPFHQRSVDQRRSRPVAGRRPWLHFSCAHVSRRPTAVPCLPFLFTVSAPRSPPSSSLPFASHISVWTAALGLRGSQLPRHVFGFLLRGGAAEVSIWFGPASSFDSYADLVRSLRPVLRSPNRRSMNGRGGARLTYL